MNAAKYLNSPETTLFQKRRHLYAADLATMQTLVDASTYDEKVARTTTLTCKDGSTKSFAYAAEDKVCNAHLSPADAASLEACLQLGPGRPVW